MATNRKRPNSEDEGHQPKRQRAAQDIAELLATDSAPPSANPSPVTVKGSPAPRHNRRSSDHGRALLDASEDGRQSRKRKNKKGKGASKKPVYQYGNYVLRDRWGSFDGKRDSRLTVLHPAWFTGKICLDIGCHLGDITLSIGAHS